MTSVHVLSSPGGVSNRVCTTSVGRLSFPHPVFVLRSARSTVGRVAAGWRLCLLPAHYYSGPCCRTRCRLKSRIHHPQRRVELGCLRPAVDQTAPLCGRKRHTCEWPMIATFYYVLLMHLTFLSCFCLLLQVLKRRTQDNRPAVPDYLFNVIIVIAP